MRIIKIITLLLLFAISGQSADNAITGCVINSTSKGLANAKVWLKANPSISDSTDTEGNFSLELPITKVITNQSPLQYPASFKILNNRIIFSIPNPQSIMLELFDIKGKRVAVLFRGKAGPKMNTIELFNTTAQLASGIYLLKCTGDNFNTVIRLENIDGRFLVSSSKQTVQNKFLKIADASAPDSLIVLRMGYEIKKIALANTESQKVPAVTLNPRSYRLEATTAVKQNRTIEVILPSDYKDLYALPVLYLLHGGGEDHTAWRTKGTLLNTLNSFQDKEKMQAMIIVTPDAASNSGYGNYGKEGDEFYTDLTVDIRKYVESHYKVDTTRFARAISGFSMGAMQTHNLTLFYPELFGYSYPICGGLNRSTGYSESKLNADIVNRTIDTSLVHSLKAYRLHSNETDIAWSDTRDFEKYLVTVNIKHTYDFTSYSIGGHTFSYCNSVFQSYADEIFKN